MGRALVFVGAVWVVVLAGVLGVIGACGGGDSEPSPAERESARTPSRAAPGPERPVSSGVVVVQATGGSDGPGGVSQTSAAGFVVDPAGLVVTRHIGAGTKKLVVRAGHDGRAVDAELLGADRSLGLALLKVDPGDLNGELRPIELGSSRGLRPGDRVLAVTRLPGRRARVSRGTVSEVGLTIAAPNGLLVAGALSADVPIALSDAGGPLLDDERRVIGVISQIRSSAANPDEHLAVAVPVEGLKRALPALERGKVPPRAYLGVTLDDAPGGGAAIQAVLAGSPGERDGLRLGDRIVALAGSPVEEPEDVAAAVASRRPGERVNVTVERSGAQRVLPVTLGKAPAEKP